MKRFFHIGFCCVAILLLGARAEAAGLEASHVPAQAKWIVHVDIEAAKRASWADIVGLVLIAEEANKRKLRAVYEATEVDLLEDVTSLTFFGGWETPEQAVVLVRGGFNVEKLERLITAAPKYASKEYEGRKLHSFETEQTDRVTMYFHDDSLIVLSKNADGVAATVDALIDSSASVAAAEAFQQLDALLTENAVVQALVLDLTAVSEELEEHTKSPIVGLIDSGVLVFGEHPAGGDRSDPTTFLKLAIQAESSDVADDVCDVLEGFVSLARLHFHHHDKLLEALRAIEVACTDRTVHANWEWPTRELQFAIQREILRYSD